MKFIKGQWYVIGNDYYEYDEAKQSGLNGNLHWFRKAGEINMTPFGKPIATPASLTPDFSNAKEGDECFSAEDDFCIMLPSHDKHFVPAMNSNGGFDVFLPDGRLTAESKHPMLFNSYAQFMAYWAEEGLKMREVSDEN